jgi:hypothetical protein
MQYFSVLVEPPIYLAISVSLVAKAWSVLRLQLEAMTSSYVEWLRIHRIFGRMKSVSVGLPVLRLGLGLTAIHSSKQLVTKCYTGSWTDSSRGQLWTLVNTVINGRIA